MKRCLDFLLAILLTCIFFVPILLLAVLVRMTSSGPSLYWSERVGKSNKTFLMPKFRTMKVNTPALPTHLLKNPDHYLTPIGSFLRKSSLDELPQLWSIIKGDSR